MREGRLPSGRGGQGWDCKSFDGEVLTGGGSEPLSVGLTNTPPGPGASRSPVVPVTSPTTCLWRGAGGVHPSFGQGRGRRGPHRTYLDPEDRKVGGRR